MKKFNFLASLLLATQVNFLATAQDLPSRIQTFFNQYQQETPPEKVHLTLDKHTYTLGEEVWFSAFLVAGSDQILSPLSQTLYVDFFDGDGILQEQQLIYLENGRGAGSFQIPTFGKPGNYRVKAYTAWMRNFGEAYFFEGAFAIVDGAGGSFLPQVKVDQIESSNGKAKYSITLIAIDKNGNPLSDEKLSLQVIGEKEVLLKEELWLNESGQASYSFTIPETPYTSLSMELSFLENESYEVNQKIRLPYSLELADIQFLPEGGQYVLSRKSILAFRAVAPDGSPLKILGELEDADISFKSNFAGLGKIELNPTEPNQVAIIQDPMTGQSRKISLPPPLQRGLTLQVVNNPTASYVTAFIQGESETSDFYLVSQTRGIINYMIQGALSNGAWGVRIPKENLLSGINQITLLTGDGKPLLERLLFIRKDSQEINLKASSSSSFGPREKITLDILSSHADNPTAGSFAISILDADQNQDESENYGSILSNLLMSSDLQGHIYNPGYYFSNQEEATLEDLDLVMLTHGWRRFNWAQITANQLPEIENFIERGISIEGQILDQENTKKGLSGGKVTAMVGEGIEIVSTEYGPNGRFILRDLVYQDTATVTITAEDKRLSNFVDIEILQPKPVITSLPGNFPAQIIWPDELATTYQERNLMQQLYREQDFLDLEGVTVQGQTLQQEEEKIRKIYGSGDVTISPEKIPGSIAYTNVFQLIQGRVSGVKVSLSGPNVQVSIRGVGSISSDTSPLFLLDNMPVEANTLMQINPQDVASVDVFKDPAKAAIFGANGANGVIAVYTKTGSSVSPSVGGTLVTNYGGYAIPREFYQPNYAEKSTESALSDKRATIYWNPLLEISESGHLELEYWNTDIAKRHLVLIEGIDSDGRLTRFSQILD